MKLAESLYDVYGNARGWKRSSGEPMKRSFSELSLDCQNAWEDVARYHSQLSNNEVEGAFLTEIERLNGIPINITPDEDHVQLALAVLIENGLSLDDVINRYTTMSQIKFAMKDLNFTPSTSE